MYRIAMYTISRLEGAELLSVSTRTIDRYIRLGKIRMKKMGKSIQLHEDDVNRLKQGGIQEEVLIVPKPRQEETFRMRPIESGMDYKTLYEEAKSELMQKDSSIKELAYALGKIETELKNSVSLAEHKKTTYLLESSRSRTEEAATKLKEEITSLETALRSNRTVNLALAIGAILMALAAGTVWFLSL